jgi:hypothetical protein
MRTRSWDQSPSSEYQQWLSPERTGGGLRPGSSTGPTVVARLPYPMSALSLGTDGNGETVIWHHSLIGERLDVGNAATGTGPLPVTQRAMAPIEKPVADAERRRMRDADAAWSRNQLRAINEANRRAWGQT